MKQKNLRHSIFFFLLFGFLVLLAQEGIAAVSGSVSDADMRARSRKLQEMRDQAWAEKLNPTPRPVERMAPPPSPVDETLKPISSIETKSGSGSVSHNLWPKVFWIFVLFVAAWFGYKRYRVFIKIK